MSAGAIYGWSPQMMLRSPSHHRLAPQRPIVLPQKCQTWLFSEWKYSQTTLPGHNDSTAKNTTFCGLLCPSSAGLSWCKICRCKHENVALISLVLFLSSHSILHRLAASDWNLQRMLSCTWSPCSWSSSLLGGSRNHKASSPHAGFPTLTWANRVDRVMCKYTSIDSRELVISISIIITHVGQRHPGPWLMCPFIADWTLLLPPLPPSFQPQSAYRRPPRDPRPKSPHRPLPKLPLRNGTNDAGKTLSPFQRT